VALHDPAQPDLPLDIKACGEPSALLPAPAEVVEAIGGW
jgi:hypothetical protein